jgi:RNA polymerase sigma factor (sigma-70 family)
VIDDPFVTHRGLLFTVAYEMLGSAVDAEDVVQETWLRWADVDEAEVRDPRAYLVRIVTRQALNRLRSVSRRREEYVGDWLPEPLLTSPDAAEDAELAENVSIAMLTVLETLGPAERAVFVLHEVFETPYDEIAEVVGKTPAAVRQIAHRAREHVAARGPRMQVDRAQQQAAVETFMAAISSGDLHGLVEVLAPDVVLIADGGGLVQAARRPITGVATVASLLSRLVQLPDVVATTAWLNGMPGLRVDVDGETTAVSLVVEDLPDLRDPQPAKAELAGKGGGTAAVTVSALVWPAIDRSPHPSQPNWSAALDRLNRPVYLLSQADRPIYSRRAS